ncbi:carboxymuconolactone decarboxylase family protein [Methanobrevibacter cuticularis]|uniref:Carboxymuconolactone decarboxylase family protein n=1 Tax=Methanobrevibacter cuticularis TaxID=47311 RepID=A0A166DZ43_9EURY|nr:carboxymuconolactone decarboxylase family protein [Methanobrevibacter cuticularis]KZX16104.1 carboxymuconolactone decarboxylase family protein [Methanobrevibacter cuticularis]
MKVSKSFEAFAKNAPQFHDAWMEVVQKLDKASKLDKKTEELAYLAVMAATRLESGIPFHVKMAKSHGASRDEIISSILVGLPAVGNIVIQALPIALEAYDED